MADSSLPNSQFDKGFEELALDQAFQQVYTEIKEIAHRQKLKFHSIDTLNTTAIVHEAYLKLEKQPDLNFESRLHFLRIAAKAMRHLLINYAEWKMAEKRGKGNKIESLENWEDKIQLTTPALEKLLSLNDSLQELGKLSERQFQVVECRFFGGMTIEETAKALNISPATAKRDWSLAKAWLYGKMKEQ